MNPERIDQLTAQLPEEYQEALRIWEYNAKQPRRYQQRSKYWKGMKLPSPGAALQALKDLFVEEISNVLEGQERPEGLADPAAPGPDEVRPAQAGRGHHLVPGQDEVRPESVTAGHQED